MKFALLGNCAYQALVDDQACIQWLCWPRFDSSFVFGPLLDPHQGGEFSIAPRETQFTTEQAYVPNTNIVHTVFRTANGEFEVTDFAPRFLQYERSFKPTMLVRRIRRITGQCHVRIRCEPVYDYGTARFGKYTASNHIQWLLPNAQLRLTTNASLTWVGEGRPFVLDDDCYLVLTWGEALEAPLRETCEAFLARTRRYWETWVKHATLPDRFQEPVIRSALTLKLHQFEDTGAITAAATTSLPEYPGSGRNWDYRYCWLRDTCFTLGALRRLGHFEEMEHFVTYLRGIAEAAPGRLQPVYNVSGEADLTETVVAHLEGYRGNQPVRVGNHAFRQHQNDVYGEMIAAIVPMYLDVRFRDHDGNWPTDILHKLLHSVEMNLEAPDTGPWEKRQAPRLHTFSLLMHWAGATAAVHAGERCGDTALIAKARRLRERAATIIDSCCWRPALGYYADTPDTDHADASLLLMVNLGLLPPDHPRAESHVRGLVRQLTATDHLLHRYRHNDNLGDTHATFTVCGFWYAEALARLEHFEEAERVFTSLLSHANHVGLLSEDIDPQTGEQWGNFPQTYSHVGLINAAFAISPPRSHIL